MTLDNSVAVLKDAWERTAKIKAAWRAGQLPNAAAVLASYPELTLYRSVVIDLVYEEYLLREKAGAAPEPGQFAEQFPDFQASVRDMLDAHCLLLAKPELLPAMEAAWPEIGSTFENLELRSELGRGAFGRAYLAFDPAIGRLRALKLASGGSAEAQLIGRLSHPNVIDICWARRIERRTAVCMPFVGASTLADVIQACAGTMRTGSAQVILDAAEVRTADLISGERAEPLVRAADTYLVGACAIGARIAAAVDYLHQNNVVHGDLKPSNVVLEPGGSPRLIDFNLAAGNESPTALRGTPAYMAPEYLEAAMTARNPGNGAKADLFALGVLLVEFLTGRHPFHRGGFDGKLAALAAAIHKGPPPMPAAIPHSIAQVLTSCLAVDPANRPISAAVVAKVLDRFVDRERTRGRRRKRLALVFCGIALLGAVTGLARAMWPVPASATLAEQPPETAADFFDRGVRLLHEGKTDAARADFNSAESQSHDPWALAFASYCYALKGEHPIAIRMADEAIAKGARSPEIENNLGYSLGQTANFKGAMAHLDAAVRESPRLQPALYNRAMVRFQRMMMGVKDSEHFAVLDMKAALATGPSSTQLHFDSARVFSLYSSQDSTLVDSVVEQLHFAVRLGYDPVKIRNDAIFKPLIAKDSRFAAFVNAIPAASAVESSRQAKLVEPRRP